MTCYTKENRVYDPTGLIASTKWPADAERIAVALNFADQWRALIEGKLKACERHQKERPDRATALDNTHRVLTELLTEAGNEWEEVNDQ